MAAPTQGPSRPGRTLAILILIGVVTAQYTCLGGILTLSSGAIYETLGMFFPALPKESYAATLGIAVALIALMVGLLMIGRYSFFEKVLAFFVMLMGLTFVISMFAVWPSPDILRQAALPSVPDEPGALLLYNIAVSPQAQGRGVGKRLIAFTEAEARRRGYGLLRLYTNELMIENVAMVGA